MCFFQFLFTALHTFLPSCCDLLMCYGRYLFLKLCQNIGLFGKEFIHRFLHFASLISQHDGDVNVYTTLNAVTLPCHFSGAEGGLPQMSPIWVTQVATVARRAGHLIQRDSLHGPLGLSSTWLQIWSQKMVWDWEWAWLVWNIFEHDWTWKHMKAYENRTQIQSIQSHSTECSL